MVLRNVVTTGSNPDLKAMCHAPTCAEMFLRYLANFFPRAVVKPPRRCHLGLLFLISSREMRNLAEKQRRDKLNGYIHELAGLVPTVSLASKRPDKTSVLRLAANYLRLHYVANQCLPHEPRLHSLLRHAISLLPFSCSTSQVEIMGRSLLDILHPDDQESVIRHLTFPLGGGGGWLLTALVRRSRPPSPLPFLEMTLLHASQDEYVTRHAWDGIIINVDHRISVVAGYTVQEVLGKNAFTYINAKDREQALAACKQMFYEKWGVLTYRLETKSGEYIYLRSRGFIEVQDLYFICINTLISAKEGEEEAKKQWKKLYVLASPSSGNTSRSSSCPSPSPGSPHEIPSFSALCPPSSSSSGLSSSLSSSSSSSACSASLSSPDAVSPFFRLLLLSTWVEAEILSLQQSCSQDSWEGRKKFSPGTVIPSLLHGHYDNDHEHEHEHVPLPDISAT
ncbi:unnamed protein product [Darwinula stevensoni]|uniref:BHLH domain-containing protein n=1 Tax=Darwinula stevensoni TaxID=69355 RepID=A0A7R9A2C0_9CRUS|nr:unnamed protein product [Darwinula stevensoni]CAG0879178.1 unnamed protein product [Darwinula stevensoni]